jgi:hypothetical protein
MHKTPKGVRYGGRRKGTPNKATATVKEALTLAFDGIGGVPELIKWAKNQKHRAVFYNLWGKLLPTQITGEDGAAIRVKFVEALIDSPHSRKAGAALPDPEPLHQLNGTLPGLRGGPGLGEDQSGSH